MPGKTKIALSEKELSLVQNVDWILTKQAIIQKVYDLFAENVHVIQKLFEPIKEFPDKPRQSQPKIYKGENYLQLPYVIMDYPRFFDKEDIFALRTMFWWGHFFSITLHLSGIYKQLVKENVCNNDRLMVDYLYIGVNENQWQHHFEEDNFLQVSKITRKQRKALFENNNFIKLAIKFDLGKWNEMPSLLAEGYDQISAMLISFPNGEKDLSPGIPKAGSGL